MERWIIPANSKIYDHEKEFENENENENYIDWNTKGTKYELGDIVYIYKTKPFQKIVYKAEVIKLLSIEEVDHARMRFISKTKSDELNLEKLNQMGIKGSIQRSQRIKDCKLLEYIDSFFPVNIESNKTILTNFFKKEGFFIKENQTYIAIREKEDSKRLICGFLPYKNKKELCCLYLNKSKEERLITLNLNYTQVKDSLPLRAEINSVFQIKEILSEEFNKHFYNENIIKNELDQYENYTEIFMDLLEKENISKEKIEVIKTKMIQMIMIKRDKTLADKAKEKANYLCENDPLHKTFLSKKNNKNFVEAHHLIPMEFHTEFQKTIDVIGNIICLCPNCHKLVHNSIKETRDKMLEKLYYKKITQLKECGIEITLEELKKKYDNIKLDEEN